MKPCKGCKYLVAFGAACKADEILTRIEDPMTGSVVWRDLRFPNQILRPSPAEMRAESGRCGPIRKLYKARLLARIFPWAYE